MMESRRGTPPIGGVSKDALWAVMKELAAVSRAQAKLTKRLVDLIEMLPKTMAAPESEEGQPHDPAFEACEMQVDAADVRSVHATEASPSPVDLEEVVIEEDRPDAGNGSGPALASALAPSALSEAALVVGVGSGSDVSGGAAGTPVEAGMVETTAGAETPETTADAEAVGAMVTAEAAEAPAGPEAAEGPLTSEPAATGPGVEGSDAGSEGLDEVEESEGGNEMVLTLESGDAPVGVLWHDVLQIGSLSTTTVPDKITIDNDEVRIVSLGRLLHGVSMEEKYFVILQQEKERVGVACEKMLGLGPLAGLEKREGEPHIQVLRVPFLLDFSGSLRTENHMTTQTPEEQDKQGPLRALVAVRYLPARVAICRHLRGRGWQVGEAAGLEAATVSLDLGRWDALFLEARSNGEADEVEATLLRRVLERRVPVIRVGSRISGYPGHEGPALIFPFSEAELDAILVQAGRRAIG